MPSLGISRLASSTADIWPSTIQHIPVRPPTRTTTTPASHILHDTTPTCIPHKTRPRISTRQELNNSSPHSHHTTHPRTSTIQHILAPPPYNTPTTQHNSYPHLHYTIPRLHCHHTAPIRTSGIQLISGYV